MKQFSVVFIRLFNLNPIILITLSILLLCFNYIFLNYYIIFCKRLQNISIDHNMFRSNLVDEGLLLFDI